MKNLIIIGVVLTLCACAGSVAPSPSPPLLITLPNQGSLVILGLSPRMSTRANELEAATEDAARKASMYHWVYARFEEIENIGLGFFDYYRESNAWVEFDQNLEKYIDRLSFDKDKDVTRNKDGTVYVRFTYPASFSGNVNYYFKRDQSGRPEWTIRPPVEIGGFIAGVGRSGRLDRFSDTVTRSYEAAAISIASRAFTYMSSVDASIQNQVESRVHRQSMGSLTQFLILETWIDPENRAVWTLAVARPTN